MTIMIVENIDMVNTRRTNDLENFTVIATIGENILRIEWASALKGNQLKKEELESQQPPTAGSEPMIDEPTMSQQAEMASEQQKPQGTVREYKIPYRPI
uniref:Uncharacterized protein n=1 Tax=Romanomermis culicivorax TaxID=13658 RepID=A0A915L5B9_ROMCU